MSGSITPGSDSQASKLDGHQTAWEARLDEVDNRSSNSPGRSIFSGLSDCLSACPWLSQREVICGLSAGTTVGTAVSMALRSYYPDAQGAGHCIGGLAGILTYVGTVIAHELNRGTQSGQDYAANSGPTTLEQGYQGGVTVKED